MLTNGFTLQTRRRVKQKAREHHIKISNREAELVARTIDAQRQLEQDGTTFDHQTHTDETADLAIAHRMQALGLGHLVGEGWWK